MVATFKQPFNEKPELSFVIGDHLGYPEMVINTSGTVTWSADHLPFGQVYAETGSEYDPGLRYPGQWTVPEAEGLGLPEMYYNLFRWYRGGWGRYLQSDPIWEIQRRTDFAGPHSYARGNPVRFTDPLGLSACDGYDRFFGTRCCREGRWQEDTYPPRAKQICERFLGIYENSFGVQCVALCLVEEESGTTKLKDCAARNAERLGDHVKCYAKCGFFPRRGFPPGGAEIGFDELWPDFWDETWPFGDP